MNHFHFFKRSFPSENDDEKTKDCFKTIDLKKIDFGNGGFLNDCFNKVRRFVYSTKDFVQFLRLCTVPKIVYST